MSRESAKIIAYQGHIKLLSPMAHNSDESMGTDTKFRKLPIVYGDKTIRIPVYSGNAFRGILRRIMAKQFADLLGIKKGGMSDALYYTWFTGGSLKKGSAQSHIEIGKKHELRAMIPFLALLGTALGNQIIAGKVDIGIGIPISKQTIQMTGEESELSIWGMTDEVFYTRRDDLEDPQESKEKAKKDEGVAHQMKYTIEVLIPGVILSHQITANYCSDVELSCLAYGMAGLVEDGVLGGKGGTGHGRVEFDYAPGWYDDGSVYRAYVAENLTKIKEYVEKMESAL